jgi:hypothetical protein
MRDPRKEFGTCGEAARFQWSGARTERYASSSAGMSFMNARSPSYSDCRQRSSRSRMNARRSYFFRLALSEPWPTCSVSGWSQR